ncbi:MAG: 1,4-alpha-glucan branching protein GlgB [Clostridiales bacterium]|nr:1,4-alpha-glucan branching protein GlgB [Clostridiales bacterium]
MPLADEKNWAGIDEFQLYLYNEGTNFQSYEMLGPHKIDEGWRFAVWAPKAKSVALVGDFDGWRGKDRLLQSIGTTGVWYGVFDDIEEGMLYKYAITGADGKTVLKADPVAFCAELRPNTASVVRDIPHYKWTDSKWIARREKTPVYDKPMNIYEVHAASWKTHEDGSLYSYRELADSLIPYVKSMGYTHIEMMPLLEYPYDGSWGYQVTGYFAATSRYGEPEGLMYLVDKCHKNGIGIIMDWVPAHFPRDAHGLYRFDGTATYEYADPRLGEHKDWGTMVFDYSKSEVVSFLLSSAFFWVKEYHFDGLRVDAVSSMLYRDYSRNYGEWIANKYGGNQNLEAISFLQNLNKIMFAKFPNILMVAEESTAWSMVTGPADKGGLGFNYKWNMGWMNDTLKYMSMDPYFRKPNHDLLTFVMCYAYSENFILPLSHDEVVHGKKSLIDKMYGSYEEKFSGYRTLLAYYLSLPGKKLMFMGGEFGQFIEWRYDESLEWHLLKLEPHKRLHEYVREINNFYLENEPLWQTDQSWDGFKWLNEKDRDNSVLSYMRIAKNGDKIIVCANFTPVDRKKYRIYVPADGEYEVVIDTDWKRFGGQTAARCRRYKAKPCTDSDNFSYMIEANIKGLSCLYITPCKK